jgi:N-acyl-D-aspartate/D-glutamate deacylase
MSLILMLISSLPSQGHNRSEADFDIIIKNGRIIDGSGNPWYIADVGIEGDSIAAVGNLTQKTALNTIDACDLVVCPGFIDVHTHCDRGLGRPDTTANINHSSQGVTTVVTGNCGSGTFQFAETRKQWEDIGIGTNAVMLVGFGTIRTAVMGVDPRSPTQEELDKMKSILRQAMTEGAWGLSVALQYIPDRFAPTEEVIAMTEVVGEFGGVLNSHQRSEEAEVVAAVKETIRIGQETGVRINATHLKASGKNNWGLLPEVASLISTARDQGIYVTADLYTYPQCVYSPLVMVFNIPDGMESLSELVDMIDYYYILRRMGISVDDYVKTGKPKPMPRSDLLERYVDTLVDALKDNTKREQIRTLTLEGDPDKLNWVPMFGWDSFTIVEAKKYPHLIGRIISDIAREQGRDSFELAVELLSEEKNDLIISVFTMSEEDITLALKQDWVMVGSDSGAAAFRPGTIGHPGLFGTFTRILRKFVREENLLSLEDAIRKMTSLPAQFLGMKNRGLILEGFKADIVVFDPETVKDNSTYLDSHRLSSGIEYVLINGKVSIEKGRFNDILNGKVLLRHSDK